MRHPSLFLTVLSVAFSSFCVSTVAAQTPSNILVIIADDLGVDQVGVYGEGTSPAPTPIIDGLASSGVLFRNAWANPTCSPTRSCIMTGRYGYRTGVGQVGVRLDLAETSLPELLDAGASGYSHAWIGKWHLAGNGGAINGGNPTDTGWSHFAGMLIGVTGNQTYFNWQRTENGQTAVNTNYATTQKVDDALSWIGGQTTPWVCVVAFFAPHAPFHAPPSNLHTQNLGGLNPNTTPIPFYKAAVEAVDTETGRLLAGLGAQRSNTHVLFLGDNGTPRQVTEAPFTRNHAKGTPYEGGAGVPMIYSGPAAVSPGREVASVVHAVDVFATVAELADVSERPWARIDSVSIAPYLTDVAQPSLRTAVYTEGFAAGVDPDTNGYVTVRNVQFKLIRGFAAGGIVEELYDLVADPFETQNLLPTLTTPQQLAYAALSAHIAEVRDTTGRFESFGTSTCAGSTGVPMVSGVGVPRLNQSYDVLLQQAAANSAAVVTIGSSRDEFMGMPLPASLSAVGAGPGCSLFTSADFTDLKLTDGAGTAQFSLLVPNLPTLIGASFYHTWIVLDSGAQGGLTATDGLAAVIGG